MRTIGIDFGTTKTLVATWDPTRGSPLTFRLGRGKDELPTTIHVDAQGQMVFGDDADLLADHDPAGYVRCIKRKLGRKDAATEVVHGRTFPVQDLVTAYLSDTLQRVRDAGLQEEDIESAVITTPALQGESYRDALVQAATKAGLGKVTLLEEPLAAGISFLHQKQGTPLGDQALVFDWGGGTLDLAVLQLRDGQLDLYPDLVDGSLCLGGEDIDDLLLARLHADDRPFADQQHLRRAITDVKRLLATKDSVHFPSVIEISRAEFYAVIQEPLGQAMRAVETFLGRVRSNGISVNTILLAGGTAQIPIVAQTLESRFGLQTIRWDRAIEAVALGAAIRASTRDEQTDRRPERPAPVRAEPPSIPIPRNPTGQDDTNGQPKLRCASCGFVGRGTFGILGQKVKCKRCGQLGVVGAGDAGEYLVKADSSHETGSQTAHLTVDLGSGLKMEFVWIPPGDFLMGSPEGEVGRSKYEGPQHSVRISKGIWMGQYQITQAQWERVMGNNPSNFTNAGPNAPVEMVSWDDCQEFLDKLNQMPEVRGQQLQARLPTEAEWEYACRAGTTTRYNIGDGDADLDRAGWYNGNSGRTTHPVGEKQTNTWGLYDMHGNVWEWCHDWYGDYDSAAVTDPSGPASGSYRVMRGSSWSNYAKGCRAAYRNNLYDPTYTNANCGLRVACLLAPGTADDPPKNTSLVTEKHIATYMRNEDIEITSELISIGSQRFPVGSVWAARITTDPLRVAGGGLVAGLAIALGGPAALRGGSIALKNMNWSALYVNGAKVRGGSQDKLRPILKAIVRALKAAGGVAVGVSPDGLSVAVMRLPRS